MLTYPMKCLYSIVGTQPKAPRQSHSKSSTPESVRSPSKPMISDELRHPSNDALQKLRQMRLDLCQQFEDHAPSSHKQNHHEEFSDGGDCSSMENEYDGRYQRASSSGSIPAGRQASMRPSVAKVDTTIDSYTDDRPITHDNARSLRMPRFEIAPASRRHQQQQQSPRHVDGSNLSRGAAAGAACGGISKAPPSSRMVGEPRDPPATPRSQPFDYHQQQRVVRFQSRVPPVEEASASTATYGVSGTAALRKVMVEVEEEEEDSTVGSAQEQEEEELEGESDDEVEADDDVEKGEEGSDTDDGGSGSGDEDNDDDGDLEGFTLDLGIRTHTASRGMAQSMRPPPRASASASAASALPAAAVAKHTAFIDGDSGGGGRMATYQGPVGHSHSPGAAGNKEVAVTAAPSATVMVPEHSIQIKSAVLPPPPPSQDLEGSLTYEVRSSSSSRSEEKSAPTSREEDSDSVQHPVMHSPHRGGLERGHRVVAGSGLDETWRRERWLRPYVHGQSDAGAVQVQSPPRQKWQATVEDMSLRLSQQERQQEPNQWRYGDEWGREEEESWRGGRARPPIPSSSHKKSAAVASLPSSDNSWSKSGHQGAGRGGPRGGAGSGGGVSVDLSGMTFESIRDLTA
jgi:predicted kinase